MVKERVIEGGAIVDADSPMTAEEYSKYMITKLSGEYKEFASKVVNTFKIPDGGTIVEIGPGPGWIGIMIAEMRPDITIVGVEPSPDMRRVASANAASRGVAKRVEYIHGFVEDLSVLKAKRFDAVVSNDSLHHWLDPALALQQVHGVLKAGTGRAYIKDGRRDLSIASSLFLHTIGRAFAGSMFKDWKASLMAGYTPGELRDILKKAGLDSWHVTAGFLSLTINN